MPVDPYAVLQALLRAEASRARRTAPEPGSPASTRPAERTARTSGHTARTSEPTVHREDRPR
ncbi:hypothetical protein GCM10010275_52150 [Streptomyces litmocidini]|uniref:hypothetical protein n=1 Tax=Streptomyces litmocidini TaxID=67318 RepID=UPI00167E9E88|nr:hypothetical protein [Streptomyces litmocidini]GGV05912.1 hypothetical protein GCM10010275_52150 [Streptomyces litmocidini]